MKTDAPDRHNAKHAAATTAAPARDSEVATSTNPRRAKLKVSSQAVRYSDYGPNRGQSRSIWIGRKPIQFVVNTHCDPSLLGKEVEISVEIRERGSDVPLFENFWVTTLEHERQQSTFLFPDFPEELAGLEQGRLYTYYASALCNETDDFADRITRAVAR